MPFSSTRRCVSVLAALVSLTTASSAAAETASGLPIATTTVSIVTTNDGPQILFTGSPLEDRLGAFGNSPGNADGAFLRIDSENYYSSFVVDGSASSRCSYHAPTGGTENFADDRFVQCGVEGLSPTQPLRFALGAGDDRLNLGWSALGAVVDGGDGNDTVSGPYVSSVIRGGRGNDDLYGRGADDRVYGEEGDDFLSGMEAYGGFGNDVVQGFGAALLDGGPGDDLLKMAGDSYGSLPAGSSELPARPSICGAGDDTVFRFDAELDPLATGAGCETDIQSPQANHVGIHGTLAVGSTLTAVRPLLGAAPVERYYSWVSCAAPLRIYNSGCHQRSVCQDFTLTPFDQKSTIYLFVSEVFSGSAGRWEVRAGSEALATDALVGPAQSAGAVPGPPIPASSPYTPDDTIVRFGYPFIPGGTSLLRIGLSRDEDPYELQKDCRRQTVDAKPDTTTPEPPATPASTAAKALSAGLVGRLSRVLANRPVPLARNGGNAKISVQVRRGDGPWTGVAWGPVYARSGDDTVTFLIDGVGRSRMLTALRAPAGVEARLLVSVRTIDGLSTATRRLSITR